MFPKNVFLGTIIFALILVLLYLAFKKTSVAVGEDYLNLFGQKTIRKENIESILIQDKRIDVIVKKKTFVLGTHLYFTDDCFFSTQEWIDFKKDLGFLKTKLP